jgi:hypothetical protein
MKILSSLLLLAGLSACLLSACKKDDSDSEPNKKDNITAKPWVHESSGVDIDGNNTIDLPLSANVPACVLDNVLTFKTDGTATADESATKCDAADPQTTGFNWSFADNEESLVISNYVFAPLNGKFKIKTLTSTNLSVSKDTSVSGLNASIIVNLKH